MKEFKKAVLVGYVIYKTKSQKIVERDFNLGEVEFNALGCLDLEAVTKTLTNKFETFKRNKVDYELVEMYLRVWTGGNSYKDYRLNRA